VNATATAIAQGSNDISSQGLIVWLNNSTGNKQTYEIQVVTNWEIAGYSLQMISTQSSHVPEAKPNVERTIADLQQKPGAASADALSQLHHAAEQTGSTVDSIKGAVSQGFQLLGETEKTVAAGLKGARHMI